MGAQHAGETADSLPASAQQTPPPADESVAWRIVDANFNRAAEGLRTVEDYLRFGLGDRHLAGLCKQLRHDLGSLAGRLPPVRLRARDTRGDVGTHLQTPQEAERTDLQQVLAAAWERTKQALRSIEEYLKVVSPPSAPLCEQLRYQLYTLEKGAAITHQAQNRLAGAQLYVLVDGTDNQDQFAQRVAQVLRGGADAVQLRDKNLDDRQLLERARCLRRLTHQAQRLMIVNDRADIAHLSAADGVHVGQQELRVSDVRRVIGPHALIGVSTHSLTQARAAVLDGADYIGVGPVFPSATKAFQQLAGCELLGEVAHEITLPAFAIGGIQADRVEAVLQAGFHRIAVSHAVWQAPDPAAAARDLKHRLAHAAHETCPGEAT